MTSNINIANINKAEVLAALYNNSKPLGMGFLQFTPEAMTTKEAEKHLEDGPYFDYLKGRVMKVNLSGDELRVAGYDRDNGQGAAEAALSGLIR